MKRNSKLKILLILFAALLMILPALGAFGGGTKEEAGKQTREEAKVEKETITVIFPKHEADLAGAFPQRVQDFTEETGIEVKLIQMGWDAVADKIMVQMAGGGDAYDVVEFDNSWIASWLGAGWITPLDDYMPAGYTRGMVPGLVKLFSGPDGKTYGIVWNNDTRFFYYNARMLKEAGIAGPPETWEELIQQSKILMNKGIAKYGIAGNWTAGWAIPNDFHFFTYTFGGKIVDEKGCFLWDTDPDTLAACQLMVRLMREGVADPASLTYDQEAVNNIFLKGDTAFLPQGIPGLMAYVEDEKVSNVKGQVKVVNVPGAKKGMTATLTLPEAYAIPTGSQHKKATWKFIEFMTSRKTNKILAQKIGTLPIWEDLYTDPELVKVYPYWADFSSQINTARGLSILTWYGNFAEANIPVIQEMLAGKITPQEALDKMAELLSDYRCKP